MLKENIKKEIVFLKSFFWKMRTKNIADGVCLPKEELDYIGTFNHDWKKFGAGSSDVYKVWSEQVCGISSLKMLTDTIGITRDKPIFEMLQESLSHGTFVVPKEIRSPEDIKGIFHEGLLKYARVLGLEGFRECAVPLEKVVFMLKQGWFFLASINVYELWEWNNMENSGRHIVLVIGFSKKRGEIDKIYFKDPSSFFNSKKETDCVDFMKFKKCSNARGIFLRQKNNFLFKT